MNRLLIQQASEALFTMTLVIDRQFQIIDSSNRLQHHCPDAVAGQQLEEIFDIHRPRGIRGIDDIVANNKSLFLLIHKSGKFALRGQVICSAGADSQWFIFLGSPWLSWITESSPETKLELVDFPRHDSQMDQNFYMATQQAMVQDLKKVNDQLITANEASEHAKQTQADFFAVMSHEMRTPLNGVINALALVDDSNNAAEKSHLLGVANSSAKNLLGVINYILDYSKLDSGKLELEEESFDLHETVGSVRDILHAKASANSTRLDVTIDPDCPSQLLGDVSKLRQILINLVSNAVKFTDQGRVDLRVRTESLEGHSVRLCFEVEDTGIGIPTDQQDRIFDAFWTSQSKTAKGEANTGLGLNICQRMTALLNGDLSFTSSLNKGTCFRLRLPLEISALMHPATEAPVNLNESLSGKVLLVDDNQTNLLVGTMMLERMGLSVRTATDGREAVELADQLKFDLVLMDITMPEMDGETATKEIRSQGSSVPIIALTAHIGDDNRQRYLDAGMQNVIHKPIDKGELVRAIAPFLSVQEDNAAAPERKDQSVALVDEKTLATLIDSIGQTNFLEAFGLLMTETEQRLGCLLSSWVQRDLPSISREAHTIKSSAASFGAMALAEHMKLIEKACQEENLAMLVELVPAIEKLNKDTIAAFAAFNQTPE